MPSYALWKKQKTEAEKISRCQADKTAYAKNKHIRRTISWVKRQSINVEINAHQPDGGFWVPNNIEIGMVAHDGSRLSVQEVLSLIYHEYAHVQQYRRGIWKDYIARDITKRTPTRLIQNYCRLALRAEKHADKLAEVYMRKMFPGIRYIHGYTKEIMPLWEMDPVIAEPREILKRRHHGK